LEKGKLVTTRNEIHNGRARKYFRITTLGKGRILEFIEDMREFNKVSDFISQGGIK
jgi:DNA-binding PadR family transcriptional regulator